MLLEERGGKLTRTLRIGTEWKERDRMEEDWSSDDSLFLWLQKCFYWIAKILRNNRMSNYLFLWKLHISSI